MTTNDITAIRRELRPYTGAVGPSQSYRAHQLAAHVPALCDEIDQLRFQIDVTARSLKAVNTALAANADKLRAQVADLADKLHKAETQVHSLEKATTTYANEVAAKDRVIEAAKELNRSPLTLRATFGDRGAEFTAAVDALPKKAGVA